jgi:FkbM family methyltransferase
MINKLKYYQDKFLIAAKYSKYPTDFFKYFFLGRFFHFFIFKYKKNTFLIRNEDFVSLLEILEEGEYKIVNNFPADKNYYVLDLGANIGLFSLYFLQKFKRAHVLSVEASKSTFDVLAKTIRSNPGYQWESLNKAVYYENTTIFFQSSGSSTSRKVVESESFETKVPCKTVTVKDLIKSLIPKSKGEHDYLVVKMDIEGAEEKVILSNNEWIKNVDYLIIELHDDVDKEKIMNFLMKQFANSLNIGRGVSKKPLLLFTNH